MDMSTTMTRNEREELSKLVRLRVRAAKATLETLAADRRADVERQLSAISKADAERWRELTAEANRVVATAKSAIARFCDERGIRREFQPNLSWGWYGLGDNVFAARRADLRKLAYARIEAARKAGGQCLEAWLAERLTALVAGGLTSAEALNFFDSLPTPAGLLPVFRLNAELDEEITEPHPLLRM